MPAASGFIRRGVARANECAALFVEKYYEQDPQARRRLTGQKQNARGAGTGIYQRSVRAVGRVAGKSSRPRPGAFCAG